MSTNPTENRIRLVLIDDHRFVRNGLRTMLEAAGHEVVGEAGSGREGVRVAAELRPDVVLLDVGLPDRSGVEVVADLVESAPDARVVMMSASGRSEDVVQALGSGAVAYLLKDAPVEEILEAVRAAADGAPALSGMASESVLRHLRTLDTAPQRAGAAEPSHAADLTDRELAVLRLVADGMANPEIAQELSLSVGSVKADLAGVLVKLGVENRVQAAVTAVRQGLLD